MKLHNLRLIGKNKVGTNWHVFLDDTELLGVQRVEIDAELQNLCVAKITMIVVPEINIESKIDDTDHI